MQLCTYCARGAEFTLEYTYSGEWGERTETYPVCPKHAARELRGVAREVAGDGNGCDSVQLRTL